MPRTKLPKLWTKIKLLGEGLFTNLYSILSYTAQILFYFKPIQILWYNYILIWYTNRFTIISEIWNKYFFNWIVTIFKPKIWITIILFILSAYIPLSIMVYIFQYTEITWIIWAWELGEVLGLVPLLQYMGYREVLFMILLIFLISLKKINKKIKVIIQNKFLQFYIINIIAFLLFLFTIEIWFNFDKTWPGYQYILCSNFFWTSIQIDFGIDGLSLCFLSLTTFIFALLFFYLAFDKTISKKFLYTCLIIEIFLILSFYTTNLLLFYIFFESVLIPMFLMIIYWGSSKRRIKAAIYFLLYTLIGSIFLLYAILYIYNILGTLHYADLSSNFLSSDEEIVLWMAFFLPFAVKIPMFPFHIWLPEAHVEAPTIGSIILASLLLKLGGYGLLRFTIPMFPYANEYFLPLVYMLGITGILNASLTAIRQSDIKRVIAYSSIAHMNLIVLGIFTNNNYGQNGAIYLMIGHGLVSTALFFCVGVLYDRFHTRLIQYYGGIMQVMPKFILNFMIFSFANMGFPGTVNFVGEFLILLGVAEENFLCGMIASISTVLSAIYSIYLFNRISFGTTKIYLKLNNAIDLTTIEFCFLFILSFLTIFFGIKTRYIIGLL